MSGRHTGTSLHGWCLDGFHDDCVPVIHLENGDHRCGCPCHH